MMTNLYKDKIERIIGKMTTQLSNKLSNNFRQIQKEGMLYRKYQFDIVKKHVFLFSQNFKGQVQKHIYIESGWNTWNHIKDTTLALLIKFY